MKYLILVNGRVLPQFRFDTKKEARIKAQRLGHQCGGDVDVTVIGEDELRKLVDKKT